MQLRKLTYVVNVDTTKAHQSLKNIDTRFNALMSSMQRIDKLLANKDFSKSSVFAKIGTQIDSNTSKLADFNKQLGKSVTYSNVLKANFASMKTGTFSTPFSFGSQGGQGKVNERILKDIDGIKKYNKKDLPNTLGKLIYGDNYAPYKRTLAPIVEEKVRKVKPKMPSFVKHSGKGLPYSAQQHPISSAIMRGMGMSTLLHFGGPLAGLVQMIAEGTKRIAIQGVRYSYQMSQQAADVRQGVLEARGTSKTYLKNKAIDEGVDGDEVYKKASANARKFAQSTLFTERQALIAQSALAEGGLSTKKSGDIKSVANVLDATIGRYNKINITEGNIQTFIGQLSNASLSGKFNKLKPVFATAGKDFMEAFEKADVEKRWDMMISYLEKKSGGLADTILREDTALARLVFQQNRQETLLSGAFGETGMNIKLLSTSISNNLVPLMGRFAVGIQKVLNIVDKHTAKGGQRASSIAVGFGMSKEVREQIANAYTDEHARSILARELPKRYKESTTVFTKERMDKELESYVNLKKPEKEARVEKLLQYIDKAKEGASIAREYADKNPELSPIAAKLELEAKNGMALLKAFEASEKGFDQNNKTQEALIKATEDLTKTMEGVTVYRKGADTATVGYQGTTVTGSRRSKKPY